MGEIHPFVWVAIGLAIIGMVLPIPKATTDADPFCTIPSVSIANGLDPCNPNFTNGNGGLCPDNVLPSFIPNEYQCSTQFLYDNLFLQLDKTSKTSYTSTSFVSVVSGNAWFNNANFQYAGFETGVHCTASFGFTVNLATTLAIFRIRDNTDNLNSMFNIQVGPSLPISANETVAMSAVIYSAPGFITATPTMSFDVKLSGTTPSITIYTGEMECEYINGYRVIAGTG